MSLLTELFIAAPADAVSYGPGSSARFEHQKLGGLTNLEFSTLWAILLRSPWDVELHDLTPIAESDSSWIWQFPESYTALLRNLKEPEVSSAAVAWARTEELATQASTVEPVVRQLVGLAERAASRKLGLYLWMAL